jgi:hypothetical protein
MVAAWLFLELPTLYRAYETGVITIGGTRGAPRRDLTLAHQPQEFATAFVTGALFGPVCMVALIWNLRRWKQWWANPPS